MYVVIILVLRTAGGFAFSMILGLFGLIVVFVSYRFSDASWPRWVFVLMWYSGAGIGAGLGPFLAWLDPESPRLHLLLTLLLFLLAGLGGAWGGYYYEAVLPDDPGLFKGRAISSAALAGGVLATNLAAVPLGILRQMRSGWI